MCVMSRLSNPRTCVVLNSTDMFSLSRRPMTRTNPSSSGEGAAGEREARARI